MPINKTQSHFSGTALAASVITNTWEQSLRFYTEALGYQIVDSGKLSPAQQQSYGSHLSKYVLLGQDKGAVIRLIHSDKLEALPNRLQARPWDPGLCVMEIGVADVDAVYRSVIRNRFGILAPPTTFSVEGPEPLGYVEMRALAIMAPAGEQLFLTQITDRRGGTPLWEQRKDINVFPLGNVVISMEDRSAQRFYGDVFGLYPENDLLLREDKAAFIMGGPSGMGFDMCLMGNGQYKSGMEQHIYKDHNPTFTFDEFPCDFTKTGLASACWQGVDTSHLADKIRAAGGKIISEIGLPIRENTEPQAIVYQGLVGEIIELVIDQQA